MYWLWKVGLENGEVGNVNFTRIMDMAAFTRYSVLAQSKIERKGQDEESMRLKLKLILASSSEEGGRIGNKCTWEI